MVLTFALNAKETAATEPPIVFPSEETTTETCPKIELLLSTFEGSADLKAKINTVWLNSVTQYIETVVN